MVGRPVGRPRPHLGVDSCVDHEAEHVLRVAYGRATHEDVRDGDGYDRPHTTDEALCLRVARAQVQIARKLVGGGIGLLALYVAEAEIEGLELCLDRCGEG